MTVTEQMVIGDEGQGPLPRSNLVIEGAPLLSAREVCQATGVTYRQLDHWDSLGIIEPTIPAAGSGTQRRFNPAQVPVIQCLGQLCVAGAGSNQLRAAFRYLSAVSPAEWRDKVYVSPGGHISRKMMGPVALVVNLDKTRGDLLRATGAAA
jgi:hypothetical protein